MLESPSKHHQPRYTHSNKNGFYQSLSAEKYVEKGWDEENKCIIISFTLIKKRSLTPFNKSTY
jgi:hypothetical protein